MTIGSELYSDLYVAKLVEKFKQRNTFCDGLLMLLAVLLLLVSGISNLFAIQFFAKFDIANVHTLFCIIMGGLYVMEAIVLLFNFLCCRNLCILLVCIAMNVVNFGFGVYRMIDLHEYTHYFVLFPLAADFVIIPILIRSYCKHKRVMNQQEFVLLQDNQNNQIIVPKYSGNGLSMSKNSLLNNMNYHQARLNTDNLDIGEEDESNLSSNVAFNQREEDDQKAEELIAPFNTPGENFGEIHISDDD